jgi:hypothetical protein
MSARSSARKSPGKSAKVSPVRRSTAGTGMSRLRIQGISAAGTVQPWAVTTSADQAPAGNAASAAASSLAERSNQAVSSTPVRAQLTRRPAASALAAR